MKVYEALARAVIEEGVPKVFGLIGDGNMGWYAALRESGKVEVVDARHEAMAVAMAGGFARATGEVGVAGVTCGPGLTQTATSLRVAAVDHVPLVVFAGESPTNAPGFFQYIDQRRFAEACGAEYVSLRSADTAPQDLLEAFYTARTRRVPVVFGAAIDLQDQVMDMPWDYRASRDWAPRAQRPRPDPHALAAVGELVRESARPVVLLGRGLRDPELVARLRALGERIGALMATTLHAKGQFAGDPFSVGIAGAFSTSVAGRLLAEADLVLAFGAGLNGYTTEGGALMPFARYVAFDTAESPARLNTLIEQVVVGDALAAATDLLAELEARGHSATGYRTPEVRAELTAPPEPVAETSASGLVDPHAAMAVLDDFVRDHRALVCGIGHFWAFPIMGLSLTPEIPFITPCGFGSIGQALGTAIGVAKALDGPVLAVDGDGSTMMAVQEIDAAVACGARLTLVVLNDGALGAEFHKLRARGLDGDAARVPVVDFAGVARAFGADGRTATTPAELRAALRDARESTGVFVVDVRTTTDVVSHPYRRLHYGLENTSPHQPA